MTVAVPWSLLVQVPRARFIPDTIWVDDPDGPGFRRVTRQENPEQWEAAVAADAPVITQIDSDADGRSWPTSSCSQPSIVADMLHALDPQPSDSVLEIGTGTGWNAALLSRRVGPTGTVTTIEVDPQLAQRARETLNTAGYFPDVITGDGENGYPDAAPFDRIIATASVRELIPKAWLDQLRPGGRLVTPWGTDYGSGAMLTLNVSEDGEATGRFSGNLAFMRLSGHRRGLFGWEPDEELIARESDVRTTNCRGSDLDRMFNPDKGNFAIGARLAGVSVVLGWNALGERHHRIELDDLATHSYTRVDADLTDPAPFTVAQLGPRRLWDEVEAAYDWWYEQDEPGPDRFGLTISHDRTHTIWLDEPTAVVRVISAD